MKHNKTIALLVGVVALALGTSVSVYASGKKGEGCWRGHKDVSLMKNAKFELTNTAKGITLTVTSEKPEVVKAIQAHFANCDKQRGCCGHAEGSEQCKKAHETGKCKSHWPGKHEHDEE